MANNYPNNPNNGQNDFSWNSTRNREVSSGVYEDTITGKLYTMSGQFIGYKSSSDDDDD